VIAGLLLAIVWLILPLVPVDIGPYAPLAGVVLALVIIIWWLFFSRAPWLERVGALVLMILAVAATSRIVHESIRGGMMGMMVPFYVTPGLTLALVVWAAAGRRLAAGGRFIALVVLMLIAGGAWATLRTDGITGEGAAQLQWRWTPTPEQRLMAQADPVMPAPAAAEKPPAPAAPPTVEPAGVEPATPTAPIAAPPPTPSKAAPAAGEEPSAAEDKSAEWPGFRGLHRDSIVHGTRIETDWAQAPPVPLWRRAVGPGWSSFAVAGDLFYTQEQRGEEEVVSAYKLSTGEPVWRHRDPVRFWESNGGAGPRATPTLDRGRLYSFGATGVLNALDAGTGAVVWSKNVAADTGRTVPDWGFASSPLVLDDVVIVAASGTLAAYDRATGNRRWVGPRLLGSYSSPHVATIDGVPQVLLLTGSGAVSVAPASGEVLWQHDWQDGGAVITQPAFTAEGDVLINGVAMTGGSGTRRLGVARKSGGWSVEERWTSNGLKPYFNDFVVHDGHAYGFDGSILACIDLADGRRKWKGGRYGHGQLVLLPDQDVLLVLSEDGELALVGATSDQFREIARVPGIEGKTWNHPAVVGDVLLVRNGEQMAAFRLAGAATSR
jgi:outer membrane protein assembly factor BamB